MIRRSSKTHIDNLLNQNPNWNILDIGCGYTAHKNATVICDIQDLSNIYKEKHFVKLTSNILPFKDKEFVGGCDIVKEMYENGELKKVLEEKGINFKK